MIAYYNKKPEKLQKIKNNKYFYRWNITQESISHEKDSTSVIQYKCNEIIFYGQPNSNIILEEAIKSLWDNDFEKKMINDYNSAKEGLLDEKYIQKYKDFLNKRAELKNIIVSDCLELGIK